jgi:hypothetical protein
MNYLDNSEIRLENGITFDIVKNVKCVTTDVNTCKKSYELFNEPIDSNPHIFFLFETPYHMAFGHWVLECGIFLPFFKYFTDASILVNKQPHRDYKNLFFKKKKKKKLLPLLPPHLRTSRL